MYEDDIRAKLEYNPDDGLFRYRSRSMNRYGIVNAGDVAGTKIAHGYIQVAACGKSMRAHRLAFLFMTGSLPPSDMEVDHIDGNKTNNRWSNLRIATRSQNGQNLRPMRNKSGVTGVYFFSRQNQWRATICANGVKHFLGGYKTKEEAIAARKEAEVRLHGEWRRATV